MHDATSVNSSKMFNTGDIIGSDPGGASPVQKYMLDLYQTRLYSGV